MKKLLFIIATVFTSTFLQSNTGYSIDCNTDCGKHANFRYRCPTFGNPGRKCTGRDHNKYAACEVTKRSSCDLWERFYQLSKDSAKPILKLRYNKNTYANATKDGKVDEYVVECTAAAVAVISAIGAEIGGPYGALGAGVAGVFVAKRICIQSQSW